MDLSLAFSPDQMVKLQQRVDGFNKQLNAQREVSNVLDKEDFLQILITQLTHQDPTQPMEDREFIAQMAQFSTLEQMMNMGEKISEVAGLIGRSQAYALIGKTVTVGDGNAKITGTVEEVSGTDFPQIMINCRFYDYSKVETVANDEGAH